ncbi:MAG: UDP-N-acetylglucosamine 1-carboxyvinyltransferase [Clostridiales bacterium]|nr:UDP-N-acetylglucosamine 1-carboxyvinyltransferase [Clostridiales bacterium]
MENEHILENENQETNQNFNIVINGQNRLDGEISVDTSKNALLPILAGCILCDGEVVIHNPTYYTDVLNMLQILKSLGISVVKKNECLIINAKNINNYIIPHELSSKLRASIFCLGPLVAKVKKARLSHPGGCSIGQRKFDIHLLGLQKLGAEVVDRHGYITAIGQNMHAEKLFLPFPSVGATENLIMANILLNGTTEIFGCAKEPEIIDLCNFLNKMGAKIFGAGSDLITIRGVKRLGGGEYTPISDRIVAGTYLLAPLVCGGNVLVKNVNPQHLMPLLQLLQNNACNIKVKGDNIKISARSRPKNFGKVETLPYPHFPTDLQQQLTAVSCFAKGTTVIVENLFEGRFKHVGELAKMCADIQVKDRSIIINGAKELFGATVEAFDLRGSASLFLAGMGANGYTTITNAQIINRGYYNIVSKFKSLGANIKIC